MTIALALVVLLASANLLTTIRLVRSTAYGRRQKLWQGLLVWLLPVLGLVWVASMLGEEAASPPPGNPFANHDDLQARDLPSQHDAHHLP